MKTLEFVWHIDAKKKNFEGERYRGVWKERRNG